MAARPPSGRRLVCPATRYLTDRRCARRCRVGLAATRHRTRRARSLLPLRQLAGDRAHGPAGAARAAARGDRAVATRRQAPRDDRGRRIVPLGVPGRRERGSVSSPRGRADRLAAGGGNGERGAVPARDDRDGERAAAPMALDSGRGTARRRALAHHGARPAAGHAAVRCRGPGRAVAATGPVPLRGGGGTGARPGRGRHLLGRMAPGPGGGGAAARCDGGAAGRRRAARPLVAVRGGDRRLRR